MDILTTSTKWDLLEHPILYLRQDDLPVYIYIYICKYIYMYINIHIHIFTQYEGHQITMYDIHMHRV